VPAKSRSGSIARSPERMTRYVRVAARTGLLAGLVLVGAVFAEAPATPASRTFYVRQTVGEDTSDGLTPATAWRTLSRLSERVQAGDVVYVGPGLYRESVNVKPTTPTQGCRTTKKPLWRRISSSSWEAGSRSSLVWRKSTCASPS